MEGGIGDPLTAQRRGTLAFTATQPPPPMPQRQLNPQPTNPRECSLALSSYGCGQGTAVSPRGGRRNLGVAHPTGIMLSTSAFVLVAHHSIRSEG